MQTEPIFKKLQPITKLLSDIRVFNRSEAAPTQHIFRGHMMIFKLKYCAVTLMLLVALSFAFERQAHAYVDPGSGLLIFQGISAVVSGALIYFRRRIKNLFTKTPPTESSAIQPPTVSSAIDQR
jgi:hypothetical protein